MNPLKKFAIDLLEAAVLGAAVAAIALPDTITAKEAIGLIVGGAIGGLKGAARILLAAYVAKRQTAQ